jgi:hypothetical protein
MKNDAGLAESREVSFENRVNQLGVSVEKSGVRSLARFSDSSRTIEWTFGYLVASKAPYRPSVMETTLT